MALLPRTNPYGETKAISEQVLKDCAAATGDWSIALLRYFNPVGAHQSGLIGEEPTGVPNNLIPYITQVARGKLKKLQVFGNNYPTSDGTGVRDYIHVCDLAGHEDIGSTKINDHIDMSDVRKAMGKHHLG